MRSRALAIVVAAVVPLLALGVVIAQRGDSAHKPARLPILASGGAENATLGAARADAALYPYGVIVYKAGPNLPALDEPEHAYKVVAPDDAAIRRLADAFGFDGIAPDGNATFTDGDAQLSVSPSGYWGYTRQSAGGSVSSSGVAVACAPDTDCPTPPTTVPQHPADLPSQEDAKATALALLQRAGVDTNQANVTVDDFVTQWSVRVVPLVDGLQTEGFGTSITVGENSTIDYASGILGHLEPADEYPRMGTRSAIDRLNKGEGFIGPRPMIAETGIASDTASATATGASPADGGGVAGGPPDSAKPAEPTPLPPVPPCDGTGAPTTFACDSPLSEPPLGTIPPPAPQEITIVGAEGVLLFAQSFTGDEGWLVPAYRLTTSDGIGPTVLAIDDSFLLPPPGASDDLPTGKDSGSVDGGAGAGSDGQASIEPANSGPPEAIQPTGK
ncbi:MAG: hypothetical protein QOI95_3693 [Acidimicrobiaceae bacterium]|jgi:hypothetical protein